MADERIAEENSEKGEKSKSLIILEFIKFGLVGALNTAISYGIEMLFYYVLFSRIQWDSKIKIAVISVLSFFICVTISYCLNNKFVFALGKKPWKEHLLSYFRVLVCYGVTGLVMSPVIKLWLNEIGVLYWIASLISIACTTPINYALNKYWAFRKKTVVMEKKHEEHKTA